MLSITEMTDQKNRWLLGHVDVSFPTSESIKGRDLYLDREKNVIYNEETLSDYSQMDTRSIDQVYLVDFHRLTVMFAQLQSEMWMDEASRAFVLEFFAQITISDGFDMFVGFRDKQPVICGLATLDEGCMLVSDIASHDVSVDLKRAFIKQIIDIEHISHAIERLYVA